MRTIEYDVNVRHFDSVGIEVVANCMMDPFVDGMYVHTDRFGEPRVYTVIYMGPDLDEFDF